MEVVTPRLHTESHRVRYQDGGWPPSDYVRLGDSDKRARRGGVGFARGFCVGDRMRALWQWHSDGGGLGLGRPGVVLRIDAGDQGACARGD